MIKKIKISPESLKTVISNVDYSGNTVGIYSGMSQILSGGTNATSLLTGLTINIFLDQDIRDIGYYTPFDGQINQSDLIANFIFTSDVDEPYIYYVYNTSTIENKFSDSSTYEIDWGDGSANQNVTGNFNAISHLYPEADMVYTITLTQNNSFGNNIVSKKIKVPYTIIENTPQSNPDTTANLLISGYTKSRLNELSLYGSDEYEVGVPVIKYGDIFGIVDDIGEGITGYTIQDTKYFDYSENVTIYIAPSSGLTNEMVTLSGITKEEHMLHVVSQVEVQTNVFIERGKNSAYEKVQRIGEVDGVRDLENYGRGFFNLRN